MSQELPGVAGERTAICDASAAETPDVVTWLVDNAVTYERLLGVVEQARRSVWITQLAFDADCVAYSGVPGDSPTLLMEALCRAASRGVDVRVLLNASLLLDTAAPLRRWLDAKGETRIAVRGVRAFPQLLHAKMVVADDQALLIGSPFVNGYWDDSRHLPADERRPDRELGGRPLHDVSVLLGGSAVRELRDAFAELWNDGPVSADGDAIEPTADEVARRGGGTHRIARTMPRGAMKRHPGGLTEILGEIESALSRARRLVYVEHQYLSSRRVIAALVRALARAPRLEIVVVLNQNPDVTAYRAWQNARLRESGLLSHPRVGVFALWSVAGGGPSGAGTQVNQVFVHSKVITVDDCWATVGSANLDGVSLHSYGNDFSGWMGRRVFRDVRNFDVNLVLDERDAGAATAVRELRENLWHEHLRRSVATDAASGAEASLERWRACASAGVTLLNELAVRPMPEGESRVLALPYSTRSTPRQQLEDTGVTNVKALDLRFDPGWLEVHFSPNWVRNMFA